MNRVLGKVERRRVLDEIDNWATWARQGMGSGGRCGSAEGNYIRPAADEEFQQRVLGVPVDAMRAEAMERIVSSLPRERDRVLLRAWYVDHVNEGWYRIHMRIQVDVARMLIEEILPVLYFRLDSFRQSVLASNSSYRLQRGPTTAPSSPARLCPSSQYGWRAAD